MDYASQTKPTGLNDTKTHTPTQTSISPWIFTRYLFLWKRPRGSPFCAKVRNKLCELELDYIMRNVPKGSKKREYLQVLGGKQQVPFLVDQSRGVNMYESEDIIAYLEKHYSRSE